MENPETTYNESNKNEDILVGLDIGTSKICALVTSRERGTGNLKILGIGITESNGLDRGVVTNIEKAVKAIRTVIDQAEQQSGIKIEEVVVGIAGDHIESLQTRGIVGISNLNNEITKNDVIRLIEDTKHIAIPAERRIIHVMPQDFIIDGQDGITDPIGMCGVRMEANVHIVTGQVTSIQNIHKCVERVGLKVKDIVLEPLASSKAILTEEEKEVGVAIVDIGGGTTDIAIFEENVIRWTSVFALAGKHVTDDVRRGLSIVASQAERIKREFGHTYQHAIMSDDLIMIPGIGGRQPTEINKSMLCEIIEPRMAEIFEFAYAEIKRSGYDSRLGAGIVLTGGTTLLQGTEELAREIFRMPVKIGIPSGITYTGLAPEVESPIYSTAVGLALYAFEEKSLSDAESVEEQPDEFVEEKPKKKKKDKNKKSIWDRIRDFFNEL